MSTSEKPKPSSARPSEPASEPASAPRRVANLRELGDLARAGKLKSLRLVRADGSTREILPPVN